MQLKRTGKLKCFVICMALFIFFLLIMGIFFVFSAQKNLYAEKVQYMAEINQKSADLITARVYDNLNTLEGISVILGYKKLFDLNNSIDVLKLEVKQNHFKRLGIIFPDGKAYTTDGTANNLFERDYFKKAMAGESNISDKLIDTTDQMEINAFAVPVYYDGEVKGVFYATQNAEKMGDMLSLQSFDGQGYSYIIKSDGTPVMYSEHESSLGRFDNLLDEMVRIEENQSKIDSLINDMREGLNGTIVVTRDNIPRQLSYTKIGINDWYIITVVPTAVISRGSDQLIKQIVLAVMSILISLLVLSGILYFYFRKNRKQLETLAYVDTVTGCPNWNKFEIDCQMRLEQHMNRKYAMVSFDVDKFKVVNDIYGHVKGDELLRHISSVLFAHLQKEECFSRTSADSFNLLMIYQTEQDIIDRVAFLSSRIADYIENYVIELSFGICKVSNRQMSVDMLSDRANLARNLAKTRTGIAYAFFNESMRNALLKEKEIENCMEAALQNHEFKVFLQPKYRFSDGSIIGAEALVRWYRPGKGILPPMEFIPLFEKNGFIKKLDCYMFEQVCGILKRWKDTNRTDIPIAISVNLSRMHLNNTFLPQELLSIANKYGVTPHSIEIELTESAVFEDTSKLIEIMQSLKTIGFSISIDDFGSGYSSLNVLKDLPTDTLKLDKVFIDKTANDVRGREIVVSLIRMAKALGLTTVAEGVETADQVAFLKAAGCDIAQGYYYARPMPVQDFENLLK